MLARPEYLPRARVSVQLSPRHCSRGASGATTQTPTWCKNWRRILPPQKSVPDLQGTSLGEVLDQSCLVGM